MLIIRERAVKVLGTFMNYKIGFIGCGNMASAIIQGIIKKTDIKNTDIIVSDASEAAINKAYETLGVDATRSNTKVVSECEVLFLSIKPQFYQTVLEEIKDKVSKDQIIVTIAPGKTITWLKSILGNDVKLVRTMPNTPALVGEGVMIMCEETDITEDEKEFVKKVYEANGTVYWIPEKLMDSAGTVAGCTPAFVAMFS